MNASKELASKSREELTNEFIELYQSSSESARAKVRQLLRAFADHNIEVLHELAADETTSLEARHCIARLIADWEVQA